MNWSFIIGDVPFLRVGSFTSMTIPTTVKNLKIFISITISCMKNLLVGVDNNGMKGRKGNGRVGVWSLMFFLVHLERS